MFQYCEFITKLNYEILNQQKAHIEKASKCVSA